ncbi:MAG: hypothetical protein ACNA76_09890, partial [Anaerosomatales bacterium]
PETFNFLGFTHIAAKTRSGRFVIRRKSIGKRLRRKLHEIKKELRRRFNRPVPEVGRWLRQVLQGIYQYAAVPYNVDTLNQFRYEVSRAWLRALRRRSQKARKGLTWEKFKVIQARWLPTPRVLHPWPNVRFRRRYPRQEPYALCGEPAYVVSGLHLLKITAKLCPTSQHNSIRHGGTSLPKEVHHVRDPIHLPASSSPTSGGAPCCGARGVPE